MEDSERLLAAGDPKGALERLQGRVREHPADARLRVYLFQLLAVLDEWERALNQLAVCGELDAGTLAMVNTYREAVKCERLREAVFAGRLTPVLLGEPQPWVAMLVEALQADGRGDAALASKLRTDAFEAAPPTAGTLDGQAFEWIADADSRLGPVLEVVVDGRYAWVPFGALAAVHVEAPADLRDLVWLPVQLTFANGGQTVALVPSRYVGSGAQPDGALQLSRKTEWVEIGPGQYRGLGQRVLATDAAERGLLESRQIVLQPAGPAH